MAKPNDIYAGRHRPALRFVEEKEVHRMAHFPKGFG
jgi:hypothetical protein